MRVALVYDWVNKWGGAERLLLSLHEIWPEAPLFTAVYNPKKAKWAKKFNKIYPSFLNYFPLAKTHHEIYPWLIPLAFESFIFDNFDVVISITSANAKGIITKPNILHICYCLTPTRYLWSGYKEYFPNKPFQALTLPLVKYLKSYDKIAALRPDYYLAISKNVQKRIKKYYKRDSQVIYPPVDTEIFKIKKVNKNSNFYLVVSRLVSYKKIGIAVKAFNQLGYPLKIVGRGNQLKKLKRIAKPNIEFVGELTDKELLEYYQKCRAVIYPQEEDFGLVPLEAQACGKPVIAFKSGGALETVKENKTGVFFENQNEESLITALRKFEKMRFDPLKCRKNALSFRKEKFLKEFKKIIEEKWKAAISKNIYTR